MGVELKGRKVLVLGLGDTGLSMARWLARRGASLRVADTRAEPPGAAALADELPDVCVERGPLHAGLFAGQDLIALTLQELLHGDRQSRILIRQDSYSQ